jgi:hypothetical protein
MKMPATANPIGGEPARGRGPGAHQPADQRVRRAAGQAQVPGQEVPGDGADESRHHDDQAGLDREGAGDGVGDLGVKEIHGHQGADEVEDGRDDHRLRRRQRPSRDRGRDGVGGVVETVGEIESYGDQDGDHEEDLDLTHLISGH